MNVIEVNGNSTVYSRVSSGWWKNVTFRITSPLWGATGASPLIWWRHQMKTFSALLAICAGNSPVPGEFPAQRPVTRGFDVFSDLRLNKRLSKQSWGWWLETLSCSLWRQSNGNDHTSHENKGYFDTVFPCFILMPCSWLHLTPHWFCRFVSLSQSDQ